MLELGVGIKVSGKETISDLEAKIKTLKAEFKALAVDNIAGQKMLGDAIKNNQNQLDTLRKVTRSSNAEMKDSYFSVGEELRRHYRDQRLGDRVMRDVASTASMLGGNIGMLVSSFQQAEFGVNSMAISMQGAGGKIEKFGSFLSGVAVPAAIGVAAIFTYIQAVNELEKQAKAAEDRLFKAKLNSGTMTVTEQREALIAERSKKIQEEQDMQHRLAVWESMGLGKLTANFFGIGSKPALDQLAADIMDLDKQIADMYSATVPGAPNAADFYGPARPVGKKKPVDISGITKSDFYGPARPADLDTGGGKTAYFSPEGGTTYIGDVTKPGWTGEPEKEKTIKEQWDELNTGQEAFVMGLTDGVRTLSSEITTGVGGAIKSVFGEANSLFEQFVSSVIAGMVSIFAKFAVSSAIKGIFSLIPGAGPLLDLLPFARGGVIAEPVFGVGSVSGRGYMIGEEGPERVIPMAEEFTGGSRGGEVNIDAIGRALSGMIATTRGSDIRYVYDRTLMKNRSVEF